MSRDEDGQLQQEIEEVAYGIWQSEGEPSGRAERHWDAAKEIVATRASDGGPLQPVRDESEPVEPLLAVENQAVAPELTDQAERNPAPRRGHGRR